MSKRVTDNDELNDDQLLVRAAAVVTTAPSHESSDALSQLTTLLSEEFSERKRKRDAERDAALRLNENARLNADLFNQRIKNRQNACNHLQPAGESDVRGQYLSNGKLHLRCQICQTAWVLPDDHERLPMNLRPKASDVGQPSVAF